MKIIHTSDWHLGHVLFGYDRQTEQQSFLEQLTDIVRQEQPDVLVVSGDIYHSSTPSASVQKMYTDAMLGIHQACPSMTIVVTAGNHDSSSKLEIDGSLWEHFGVQVIGSIERKEDGTVNLDKHLIEVKNRQGNTLGFVVAVPHVYPQNFPLLDEETSRENRQTCFFQKLLDETSRRNPAQLPVVLMAHLSVEGSDRTGHDDTAGGIDYVPLRELGQGYDYLALGHIHCPQDLKGSQHRARYCGTPLAVNFDESYPHSVSVVELIHGQTPVIRTVEIKNPIPLVTLPKEPAPFQEVLQELQDFPNDLPAYLRLNVWIDDFLPPNANEQASEATKGKKAKFCYIKTTREQRLSDGSLEHLSLHDLRTMSPLDIAKRYFLESEGTEMDEELCSMLDSVLKEINETD